MANPAYTVRARWDDASKSWWTDGEDIPGLCVQAASFDDLVTAVLELAPEIMRDNGLAAARLCRKIVVPGAEPRT
jgi:hypothetical protein